MKHDHLICENQQSTSNPEKSSNGEPQNSDAPKEDCATKEDEDGRILLTQTLPPNLDKSDEAQPTTNAGSLQFYQGGKLVLKLQARKEEENYRWVKIKEWDTTQQPKKRKRYRKKLPKDRVKVRTNAFSSTDSEEEPKIKAKPKSFLLHKFRISNKQKDTPVSKPAPIDQSLNSPSTSDYHRQNGNGLPPASHASNSVHTKIFKPSTMVESGDRNKPNTVATPRPKNTAKHNCNFTVNNASNVLNGYYCREIPRPRSLNTPELFGNCVNGNTHNNHHIVASTSRLSDSVTMPSQKRSSPLSNPRQSVVSPISQSSPVYPQVSTVPIHYLPSYSSPPTFQVPHLYYSTSDTPLDLSVKK